MRRSTRLLLCLLPVCALLSFAMAESPQALTAAGQPYQLAEQFFASPYVSETPPTQPWTIETVADGWRMTAPTADGQAVLTLVFTQEGRLEQYGNTRYPLPAIADSVVSLDGVDDTAYADAVLAKEDALYRALAGKSFDSICCFAYDGAHRAYAYSLNRFESYAIIQIEPELKLLSYGDMLSQNARYGDYLSQAEAVTLARAALTERYPLKPTDTLLVSQANFTVNSGEWTEADAPLPYWYLSFATSEGGVNGDYIALIDAATGDTLNTCDPLSAPKG